jgi:hypothetical protein
MSPDYQHWIDGGMLFRRGITHDAQFRWYRELSEASIKFKHKRVGR